MARYTDERYHLESKIEYNRGMSERDRLPTDAMFPAPPCCTLGWAQRDWIQWWISHGKLRKTP